MKDCRVTVRQYPSRINREVHCSQHDEPYASTASRHVTVNQTAASKTCCHVCAKRACLLEVCAGAEPRAADVCKGSIYDGSIYDGNVHDRSYSYNTNGNAGVGFAA